MKKICFILMILVFSVSTASGGESVTMEDLFGIPVTRWIFEGSNGVNQYKFEWEYPKSAQSIDAEYGYYFNFQFPNIVDYTYATPITFQNGKVLVTEISRKGTFSIKKNVVTIDFTEATHRIPDTFGKLAEAKKERLTIVVEVETDGRTQLQMKQISGENIFEKNDKYKKIKFVASILPELR